jgi:hypothetical protein
MKRRTTHTPAYVILMASCEYESAILTLPCLLSQGKHAA